MIVDQATKLRRMVKDMGRRARVVAVTSGKGGVGKTNIAVNLGITWAGMGKRVILLDLDLGLANVDVVLDLRPRYNLSHVVMGKVRIHETLLYRGGMGIVPGSSGVAALADLDETGRTRLIEDFRELETRADIILLDTAAGVSRNVLGFLAAADEVVVVATPDPTSVIDAYALVKMLSLQPGCGRINLVVNMARDRADGLKVGKGIVDVSRRFLSREVRALGYIPVDPVLAESVRRRQPFVLASPGCSASKAVRGIGRALLGEPAGRENRSEGFLSRVAAFLSGREVGRQTVLQRS